MNKYVTEKLDRVSMTRSEHFLTLTPMICNTKRFTAVLFYCRMLVDMLLYPSLIIMSKSDVYQSLTSWLPPVLSLQWALKPLTNAIAASYGDSALILASTIGISS